MARFCSWLLVLVLVCFVGADVAWAKAKGKGHKGGGKKGKQSIEQVFQEFDKDKDGKLSKSEFVELKQAEVKQRAEKIFATADTNHDGSLSLDELKAASQKKGGKKS
jgi:Ca2+-binding EF-hand superfamily protein